MIRAEFHASEQAWRHQHRRRTDRAPAVARIRTFALPTDTDHKAGWLLYGMALPLPVDASAEMRLGYADHRETTISVLCAQEAA